MQTKQNKQLVPLARQLRKEMTKEERHLWYDFLRSYPVRFSRQKILGKFIVDFYCAEAKLVIELDGSQHYDESALKKDAERTAFLKGYDLRVIRIPNNEVSQNFRGVCEHIDTAVRQSLSQRTTQSLPCARGGGSPAGDSEGSKKISPNPERYQKTNCCNDPSVSFADSSLCAREP